MIFPHICSIHQHFIHIMFNDVFNCFCDNYTIYFISDFFFRLIRKQMILLPVKVIDKCRLNMQCLLFFYSNLFLYRPLLSLFFSRKSLTFHSFCAGEKKNVNISWQSCVTTPRMTVKNAVERGQTNLLVI